MMRILASTGVQLVAMGILLGALSATRVAGQDSAAAPTTHNRTETVATNETAPVQLSAGAWDVLKLVRSKIGDDTIIAFINNSGQPYNLGASEIIYLREQGASDRVTAAMLNQQSKATVNTTTANETVWSAPSQPAVASTTPATTATTAPAYVEQPSSVYVAQPAPAYSYYYPYPAYGYSYWAPVSLSFGFGFGGYYGGHYYHGGHGGGYHGHH